MEGGGLRAEGFNYLALIQIVVSVLIWGRNLRAREPLSYLWFAEIVILYLLAQKDSTVSKTLIPFLWKGVVLFPPPPSQSNVLLYIYIYCFC